MFKLIKTIIAIVGLLSLSQLHNANAAIRTQKKQSYSYPQKQVMYNAYAFKEGNLVYAVCNAGVTERNCTIIQRQFPDDKVTRFCDIKLRVEDPDNDDLSEELSVHAFGQDNAIVFWGEMDSHPTFNLMAIQMSNCKTKTLQLDDLYGRFLDQQTSAHKLVTYDNDFDIFFDGLESSNASAGTQVGMRVGFDNETQPTSTIIKSSEGELVRFISPIATRSPAKGYVYSATTTGKDVQSFWLAKPEHDPKKLSEYPLELYAGISAIYDVITTCSKSENNTQTTCTQYDENGDVKFKTTLDHGVDEPIMRLTVHNSPRGGFLLMTASLIIPGKLEQHDSNATSYDVIRVDGEAKKVGSVRLNGFAEVHENLVTLSIWENRDEYCAALIGQVPASESPKDNLYIVVNCFTENDFSA